MNLGIGLSLTNYLRVPTVALDPDAAIAALFQTGTPGVYYEGAWYDPSDSATVWQDAAGTTPATVGDPVGRIDDKSGNGNHATQTTSAARPVLQSSGGLYYLDFDGVDDLMVATYGSTFANITRAVGFRMDIAGYHIADDNNNINYASLAMITEGNLRWGVNGVSGGNSIVGTGSWNAGTDEVVVATASSGSALTLQGTGTSASGTSSSPPSAITGATIGAAAGGLAKLTGRIYGFIDIDRVLTAAEITDLETYLAAKSGVTL